MVGVGSGFFVQIPNDSGHRVLHPAKVSGQVGDVFTAELEEPGIEFEEGQGFLVYFEKRRDFLQQPACIQEIDEADPVGEPGPALTISFVTQGEAVSAESRQCYRVSTVMANMTAKLGEEGGCQLLDVSATGFSAIAAAEYRIGDLLDAVLELDGAQFTGKVAVQSIRELSQGRIRYGTHCADSTKLGGTLKGGLNKISMFVQRQQLQRLSGAV